MRNLTDDQAFALAVEAVGDYALDGIDYGTLSDVVKDYQDLDDELENEDIDAVEGQVNLILEKLREVLENIEHH